MQQALTAPPAAFLSGRKQLSRFPLRLSHARCSSVNMLLKLMWNDSNSSHPSPHPQSCQRCIVLYVHPILSSPIFAPPFPVHSKCPLLLSCLLSLPPPPDFLLLTYMAVWHAHDMLIDGCPGLCNNNGRCVLDQNVWHCICQSGWRGLGCDVATETLCSDGKDNEGGRQK